MSALGSELGRLRRRWVRPRLRRRDAGVPIAPSGLRTRTLGPGPVLVVAATAVVGFLLVGQLGTSQRFRQQLQAESEEDLARILASLTDEADALRDEISDLRLQLVNLNNSSRQDGTADRAAREQLKALSVLAGTVAVTGPGLTLVVDDPEDAVGYDVLIDAVQELRDAGAEAVAINDLRMGVASSLAQRDDRILLDGSPLSPPYRVTAVGQATTLEGGLKIPGGVLDALDALRGVRAEVQRSAKLDVPALSRPPAFRVARPVGSGP
ncbi:MAG TPA: DUF881 domain-containing protein [Acidimicrobiales bacterium]|nr:DUF881 domain-containing protein [Acidimicrobiales bacterium]